MALSMLIAYDASGNVVATLDSLQAMDGDRSLGAVDFDAAERLGLPLTELWVVNGAKGSGTWPEFLGYRAHDFRVERENGRIARLVHQQSKHVRHRIHVEAAIEKRRIAAIAKVRKDAKLRPEFELSIDVPHDVTDLTGTPSSPLDLDEKGRTRVQGDAKAALPVHGTTVSVPEAS